MSCKEEPILSEIAKQFQLLVLKSGKTRLQIAEYLSVNERTVYRWLSGESKPPKSVILAIELMPF
jgi:transcriptional regulator with XRE-family HTH domain